MKYYIFFFFCLKCNSDPIDQTVIISGNDVNHQISDIDIVENPSAILKYLEDDLGYGKKHFSFSNHSSIKCQLLQDITNEAKLISLENMFKNLINENSKYKDWSLEVINSIRNNLRASNKKKWYEIIYNTLKAIEAWLESEALITDLKANLEIITNFLNNYKDKTNSDVHEFIHSFINFDLSIYLEFLRHINNTQYRDYLKSLTKLGLLRIKHIPNVGNTCYLDSAVNSILWIFIEKKDLFVAIVSKYIEKMNESDSILVPFSKILLTAFFEDAINRSLPDDLLFALAKNNNNIKIGKQGDYLFVFDTLYEEIKQELTSRELRQSKKEKYYDKGVFEHKVSVSENETYLSMQMRHNKLFKYFYIVMKTEYICKECNFVSFTQYAPDWSLRIGMDNSDKGTCYEVLKEIKKLYYNVQNDEYEEHCDGCGKDTIREIKKDIIKYPLNVIIRINIDYSINVSEIKFPFRTKFGKNNDDYELKSCIVKYGSSLESGHYIVYFKDINGIWHKSNDLSNDIVQVTAKDILDDNKHITLLIYSKIHQ